MGNGVAHIAGHPGRLARSLSRSVLALLGAATIGLAIGNQAPAAPPAASQRLVAADQLLPPLESIAPAAAEQPSGSGFELTLRWPEDSDLDGLLLRAGATATDSRFAAALVRQHYPDGVPGDSDVKLTLDLAATEKRPIKRLAILNDLGALALVRGRAGPLEVENRDTLSRHRVAIEGNPYWALRRAGIDGATSADAERLLPDGALAGTLRLVIGERPDRFSERPRPQLLYMSWSDVSGERRSWLRWGEEPSGWLEVGDAVSTTFARPVAGRLTSAYGLRRHPILGFARLHSGVDFAAARGTPVRAAAGGVVVAAGWRGGYGRQVQIVHPGASATSYAHLSAMVVEPGMRVRRGQVIGYVGASGLATGPHLHFEVMRGGRPIDPLRAGAVGEGATDARVAALVARLTAATPT